MFVFFLMLLHFFQLFYNKYIKTVIINDNYCSIISIYYFCNQKTNTLRSILAVLFFFYYSGYFLGVFLVKDTLKNKETNKLSSIWSSSLGHEPNLNYLKGDISGLLGCANWTTWNPLHYWWRGSRSKSMVGHLGHQVNGKPLQWPSPRPVNTLASLTLTTVISPILPL